ncbi:MAG: adenylate/guanylate cyclase domain-containing protein [Propionicimonas sp.]|uniref:adenylate/guanylate cyclase domain-containing protein n=1 Tax=Propionicimonas sp. TaxID=1955623 RepID=UPI003D121FED
MAVTQCGSCGVESPAGKRFCAECGAPLILSCPECGASVSAGQRFCADCGTPLATAGTAPGSPPTTTEAPVGAVGVAESVSERRLCSVLFVDMVGFTTLSEGRDPEEVRELLSHYFDLARTVVGRYGGVVEKFIGDAVMAVWGSPVATEFDAERAVRAALDLLDGVRELGAEAGIEGLAARAGVLTGDVAVTIGATNQGMVAGDAVNTAARIQSVAEPGSVLVDGTTQRLTENAIDYTDHGQYLLKGKSEHEHLWRADQVVSASGGSQRVDGLEAPLTGRNAELRTIREMFHASDERRHSRLVLVTGPAGVGKSRLGWEFEKYADGLVAGTFWHRGRCLSYGKGMVYWALAEVVRRRLQIGEDDAPDVAEARFLDGLARWVPDQAERDFIGPRLGRLLGISYPGDSGGAMAREDLFAGWRRFFERLASTDRVAILIEDLHNASPDLLDFLDHLVDWSRDLPIFVLAFARPELDEKRPGFGTGRNRVTIALDALDPTSMDAIVDALVPGMPAAARERITERAEGVPLYALESIRSLIDRGVIQAGPDGAYHLVGGAAAIGELSVPDSLRALLAARLDALDPVARKVVGDASVLGTTFPAEAVVAVSGLSESEASRVLAELVRREVLQVSADPLSPQRGNYGFAQEMLRQVAYDTLSRRDRKTRHLTVAGHLRASFPNDGEEVVDAIARHYQDALEAAPQDPDVPAIREALVATLLRAADRSERTGAPARAVESYVAAADIVSGADPAQAARLLIRAGTAGSIAVDQSVVIEITQRARDLAAGIGETRLAATATARQGRSVRRTGRHTEARDLLTEALTVLRNEPDLDTLDALEALGSLETFAGTVAASPLLEEAVDLANRLGVGDLRFADLLVTCGIYYDGIGQRRLSEVYLYGALGYYATAGPSSALAQVYLNLGNSLLVHDPRASVDASERALALAAETGGTYLIGTSLANLAYAHLQLDDWDPALEALHHPLLELVSRDPYVQVARAQVCALRGDPVAAEAELAPLSEGFVTSEDPQDRSALAAARMQIALAGNDPDEAARQAEVCMDVLGEGVAFGGDDGRLVWPAAARLFHNLGRFDREAEVLGLYARQPKAAVAPLQVAEAALITARLAAARGEEAAQAFASAIEQMRRLSPPYHLAHGLLDHAEYLRGHGDAGGVRALVEEAASIALGLRCAPLAARAEAVSPEPSRTG